jgi:uncharacterized repeat protein (TIGR01451 family)
LKKFLLAPHLLVFVFCCAFVPAARGQLDLKVTATPTSVTLNGTVTYSITVSNLASIPVNSVQITSTFPPTAEIVRAVNTHSAAGVQTNRGSATFPIGTLLARTAARVELELRPAATGDFANSIQAAATGVAQVATNVVVSVGQAQVDLGVGVEGFPSTVLIGDIFDYTVTVTNFGPAIAESVSIQSALPASLQFLSVTPVVPSNFNTTNRMLTLSPGTFTNSTARDFIVRLQASAAGTPRLVTTVAATENRESEPDDNGFTNQLTILDFVTNNVVVMSVSPQRFNRQNALIEQLVIVTNLSTNVITSIRVLVTNLVSPNRLFNASGTNAGRPYVMLPVGLGPKAGAGVVLQYYSPLRETNNARFVAVEGPNLAPLFVPIGGTIVPISRLVHLRDAYDPAQPRYRSSTLYIEFRSTAGRTYSLVYTPDLNSTNWFAAQPPIVANSTFSRFIDAGPQITADGDRFYRVIEHQQNQ